MANEDSTINRLEECCKSDDSAKFAEVVEPASKKILQKAYRSHKNYLGWPTVGAYLLYVAVKMKAIQCLRIILGYVSANVKNEDGWTPLHEAAQLDDPNVAKVLLEHGAQVNATDNTGWSSIHWAAYFGNVQTLSFLCSVVDADLNLKSVAGGTPLYIAVYNHHTESVNTLLHFGVRTGISDRFNTTPRDLAVQKGYQDIVNLLDMAAATTPKEPAFTQPTAAAAATAAASSPRKPKESAAVRTGISAGSSQSKKGVPSTAALPEERHRNPWKHPRFIETTYSLQEKLTQLVRVRGLCYSLHLIGTESYDQLQLLKSKFDHNEKLLYYLKTGDADSFAKFREVMRHLNQEVNVFAKILEKWDTIGPFKEDYQHIERQLND